MSRISSTGLNKLGIWGESKGSGRMEVSESLIIFTFLPFPNSTQPRWPLFIKHFEEMFRNLKLQQVGQSIAAYTYEIDKE